MQSPDHRFPDRAQFSDGKKVSIDPVQMDHIRVESIDRLRGNKREQAFRMPVTAGMPEKTVAEIHHFPAAAEKQPPHGRDPAGKIIPIINPAFHSGGKDRFVDPPGGDPGAAGPESA